VSSNNLPKLSESLSDGQQAITRMDVKIDLGFVSCVNIMLVCTSRHIIHIYGRCYYYDDINLHWMTSLTHLYCIFTVLQCSGF